MRNDPKDRFLDKVNKNGPNGCWEWTASVDKDGYGKFFWNRMVFRAHRFSYVTFVGPISDGLLVCHKCDNPRCVNPKHLWLGDNRANLMDSIKKGRAALGERHWTNVSPEKIPRGQNHGLILHPECVPRGDTHWKSKLTADIVRMARVEYVAGAKVSDLAYKYNINRTTMSMAVRKKTWKHLG